MACWTARAVYTSRVCAVDYHVGSLLSPASLQHQQQRSGSASVPGYTQAAAGISGKLALPRQTTKSLMCDARYSVDYARIT